MIRTFLLATVATSALLAASSANAGSIDVYEHDYVYGPIFESERYLDADSHHDPFFTLFGHSPTQSSDGTFVRELGGALQLDFDATNTPGTEVNTLTGLRWYSWVNIDDRLYTYYNGNHRDAHNSFYTGGHGESHDANTSAEFGGDGNAFVGEAAGGIGFAEVNLDNALSVVIAGHGAIGHAKGTDGATVSLVTGADSWSDSQGRQENDSSYYYSDFEAIGSHASGYSGFVWHYEEDGRSGLLATAHGDGTAQGLKLSLSGNLSFAEIDFGYTGDYDETFATTRLIDDREDDPVALSIGGSLDLGIAQANGSEGAFVATHNRASSHAGSWFEEGWRSDYYYYYDDDFVEHNGAWADSNTTSENRRREKEDDFDFKVTAEAFGEGNAKIKNLSLSVSGSASEPGRSIAGTLGIDAVKARAEGVDGSKVEGSTGVRSHANANDGNWQHYGSYYYYGYYENNDRYAESGAEAQADFDVSSVIGVPSEVLSASVSGSYAATDDNGYTQSTGSFAKNLIKASGSDIRIETETRSQSGTGEYHYSSGYGWSTSYDDYRGAEANTYATIDADTAGHGLVVVDHKDESVTKAKRDRELAATASATTNIQATGSPYQVKPGVYVSVATIQVHHHVTAGRTTNRYYGDN